MVNRKPLKRCFIERTDKEIGNSVGSVEDRIQNLIFTATDCNITPKIELAITSMSASSGRHATTVMAGSKPGKNRGITASFENLSESNKTLQVLYTIDETRNTITDEVSELSLLDTHFVRQPHIHLMLTGQTDQTN